MKTHIILALTAILTAGMVFGTSCSSDEQRISELEQQVELLAQQLQSTENMSPTWVHEDDFPVESIIGWENPYKLTFNLKVGDRIEGEVTIDGKESIVVGQVKDPYGNIISKTNWINPYGGFHYIENSGFPWRFAFIAQTEGQFEVRVFTYSGSAGQSHLKIMCYE